MSSRHANRAVEILYSRYTTCLRDVDIPAILPHLMTKNLLTSAEQKSVLEHTTAVNQRRKLCKILAQHGSSRLVATTTMIQEFRKSHMQPQTPGNEAPSSSGAAMREKIASPLDSGNGKHDSNVGRHVGEGLQNGGYSSRGDVSALANEAEPHVRSGPSSPLIEEPQCHEQMEAFIVLFFTFIYQILHGVHKSAELNLPWFDASTSLEEVREYFPADVVRGINPGGSVQLHSSLLLEAFSQFYQKHDRLLQENRSLASTAKLVHALTKKCTELEEELSQCRKKQMHYSRSSSTPRDRSTTEEELRRQVSHLKAKVIELTKQAEPLRRTLAKSEDRNKQLVDVTQQWAIECQEKENQIAVRDSQIRELRGEIDPQKQRLLSLENRIKELTSEREQLKKRVSKLKKQLSSASERCREERVGDSQFEELRVELSHRRELYDQVMIQKDLAEDQVRRLTSQLEESKEMAEELRDRLGNFKVQAQSREPSVKEMSHLLHENRALTEENSRLKQQKSELEDEILAYKTHMQELAQAAQHHQQAERASHSPRRVDCPQPQPRQPVKKTQTMVTGYTQTAGKKHTSHSNEELYSQRAQTSGTDDPHQASATASAGRGRPKSAPGRSKSPAHKITEKLPELREQESSSSAAHMQTATDVSSELSTTERPLSNGFTSMTGSHDYTREICYPARSGILVQPLQDDDWEILQSLNGSAQPQLPMYFDHTPLHPSKMEMEKEPASPPYTTPRENPSAATIVREDEQFFSFGQNERKCPVCQRVFLTLGEREFRSHIAGCFT